MPRRLTLAVLGPAAICVAVAAGILMWAPRDASVATRERQTASAVAAGPHTAARARCFTVSYLLESSARGGDWISYRFDLTQPYPTAEIDGLTVWPEGGSSRWSSIRPCRTPGLRCLAEEEGWFLPLIAQDEPHAETYPQDGVRLQVGPSANPRWKRRCVVYDEEPLQPGGPVTRQRYTWCDRKGVVDILVWTKQGKAPDHLVLTSYEGLLNTHPVGSS